MKIKLKQDYINAIISCPFTGKMVSLKFLSKRMYKYYYQKGLGYLFDIEEKKKPNNDIPGKTE